MKKAPWLAPWGFVIEPHLAQQGAAQKSSFAIVIQQTGLASGNGFLAHLLTAEVAGLLLLGQRQIGIANGLQLTPGHGVLHLGLDLGTGKGGL